MIIAHPYVAPSLCKGEGVGGHRYQLGVHVYAPSFLERGGWWGNRCMISEETLAGLLLEFCETKDSLT